MIQFLLLFFNSCFQAPLNITKKKRKKAKGAVTIHTTVCRMSASLSEMNIKNVLEVSVGRCNLTKDILNSCQKLRTLYGNYKCQRFNLCSVPELIQLHMLGFDRPGWKVVFVGAVDPQQMIQERDRPRNLSPKKANASKVCPYKQQNPHKHVHDHKPTLKTGCK